MYSGKPQPFTRKNLLMNNTNDNFTGVQLQEMVDLYFAPYTVDETEQDAEKRFKPNFINVVNMWLSCVAYPDPGLLATMLEEWPKDKCEITKMHSTGLYAAAILHPSCIMKVLLENQVVH